MTSHIRRREFTHSVTSFNSLIHTYITKSGQRAYLTYSPQAEPLARNQRPDSSVPSPPLRPRLGLKGSQEQRVLESDIPSVAHAPDSSPAFAFGLARNQRHDSSAPPLHLFSVGQFASPAPDTSNKQLPLSFRNHSGSVATDDSHILCMLG